MADRRHGTACPSILLKNAENGSSSKIYPEKNAAETHQRCTSVFGLRFAGLVDGKIAFAEFSFEQFKHHRIADLRQRRIVARAFIAQERMLRIEFVPRKSFVGSIQRSVNRGAAFNGDVGVLAPPDHQQFGIDLIDTVERIVALSLAQAMLVNISRIKADTRKNIRIHTAAKREVPANADTHRAQLARAI